MNEQVAACSSGRKVFFDGGEGTLAATRKKRGRLKKADSSQLELPLAPRSKPPPAPPVSRQAPTVLRVLKGGGQRVHEKLKSRDAVIRVLVEAGADMLLRRISVERAEEIQENVDRILSLFDRVDLAPDLMPVLERELGSLEALMTETRGLRSARK
jgi:hypothetical protein